MHRPRFVAALAVCALCWLVAGPGGLALQMSLACRMERMHHALQQQHHPAPGQHSEGPCMCDQMGPGPDITVSPTMPALIVAGAWTSAPVVTVKPGLPSPTPSSPLLAPPTPPPNTFAHA